MRKPTERQQKVLDFIAGYIDTHAYPPTIREVADNFSISVKGAYDHLTALKKKGLLKQGDKMSRTMELVRTGEEGDDFIEIPILGTVAAGRPILSLENMDGSIRLHRSFVRNSGKYFALRVQGDSMEAVGIMNGDMAVIEHTNTVNNGEIAVVMLDDDAVTLKTFYRECNRVKLQPENSKYSPIYCSKDVRVLGKLAHILRSYA